MVYARGRGALGESEEAAARRKPRKETGRALGELGSIVLHCHVDHTFGGRDISQDEDYSLVRCAPVEIDDTEWTATERRVEDHRWWSREKLCQATDTSYPENLLAVLDGLEEQ